MEGAIIRKLTDKIYIIRVGKNSLEAIDYIASLENSEPIKILNIKEIQNNVKEGLTKLIEPLLDKKDIDFNKDFNKLIAFIFLLKAKLYLDYILKRSLNRISIMNVMTLRKEAPTVEKFAKALFTIYSFDLNDTSSIILKNFSNNS